MNFFEQIGAFFASLPSELYVFLISILPIIELRGAIPVGAALGLEYYINYPLAIIGNMLPIPFILLFIPRFLDFLARFKTFRPIVKWLREKADKHSSKVLGKSEEKEAVQNDKPQSEAGEQPVLTECTDAAAEESTAATADINAETADAPATEVTAEKKVRKMSRGIFLGLFLFVAIPLPGTGAWTGSLVAALFDLPKKWSLLAIFLGVLLSGVIMSLASYGVLGFLKFLL